MSCGNCDSKNMRLCPFSFGLAIGIVAGLTMFFWSLWVMKYGVPPMMAEKMIMVPATFMAAVGYSLLCLLKGFLFGFFVALVYDWISCCCRARCCKSDDDGSCGVSKK